MTIMQVRAAAILCLASVSALRPVTVLGGNGYVGSRVAELLVKQGGLTVRSVSKSGKPPSGAPWTSEVEWVANDLTRGSREALEAAIGAPEVVVSCVGSIGFDGRYLELGNGVANERAAEAVAKLPRPVDRYVYVSVAEEVAAAKSWLPGYFKFYFDGKRDAEAAIKAAAPESYAFVKPSFIYGGDSFGLWPPRVSGGYGSAIEEILSNGIITKIGDVLPGLLKVALRPPVSVDAVAQACVNLALGAEGSVVDGAAAINACAGAPPATGFSDFISSAKSAASDLSSKAQASA